MKIDANNEISITRKFNLLEAPQLTNVSVEITFTLSNENGITSKLNNLTTGESKEYPSQEGALDELSKNYHDNGRDIKEELYDDIGYLREQLKRAYEKALCLEITGNYAIKRYTDEKIDRETRMLELQVLRHKKSAIDNYDVQYKL